MDALAVGLLVHQDLELTMQEIECWRMFGIRVWWVMDEIIIEAP